MSKFSHVVRVLSARINLSSLPAVTPVSAVAVARRIFGCGYAQAAVITAAAIRRLSQQALVSVVDTRGQHPWPCDLWTPADSLQWVRQGQGQLIAA